MTQIADIDSERLCAYLESVLPGFNGPVTLEKFAGGQSNPTYRLRTSGVDYVLRSKPWGELLKSAHAIDREFRVMQALKHTDVPVADAYHLCEDASIIGSDFYLMSYVEARIFWNPALPEIEPDQRAAYYDEMNRVLAAMHRLDVDVIGLRDYGRAGNYFERQIVRWTQQYQASETDINPAMDQLIEQLPLLVPPEDGRISLVHGDYRIDNLLFHPTEPRILAVVDWELSTLGHPFADLAYQCMQWRMPNNGLIQGLGGLDREVLGVPSEATYVANYCARMGLEGIENWNFYLAFSFFRLAAIAQGVKKRAVGGNASSSRALEIGELARPLSEMGLALITSSDCTSRQLEKA
ncbi:phosphotransferase [Pseudomonas juntendi]|uniref:phosphotransferase n=1 Tax=Pseudomonas juntendi TaxID=2666183 RepID=UPI001F41E5A0|nr:phosphotransferase [Pseudomonas juntendi]MCO7055724.1 phosphotransferase [Pseudomonas juntendi]UJM10286.1 phosphotransferase [Pseudomonas juntendi]UXA41110.1 phosphotransferase [Pseudomonas juntendi]